MANMSYCRFENTYRDLLDCYDAILEGDPSKLSKTEEEYRQMLIDLCHEIVTTTEND